MQSQPCCPTPIWSFSFFCFLRHSRPPYFGRSFKDPNCNYFVFKAVCLRADSWQEELFRIPRHLNIRTNFSPPKARVSRSLDSYPRSTDANRGCIQRALIPSFPLSSSLFHSTTINHPVLFSFPHEHPPIVATAFSMPLLVARSAVHIPAPATVVCTAKCALLAKRGKALPQKGRRFWGCAVLRVASDAIVNTRPAAGTFICSSASYARRLPEVPLFEWVARVLQWPRRKPLAATVTSVQKYCRFNIASISLYAAALYKNKNLLNWFVCTIYLYLFVCTAFSFICISKGTKATQRVHEI